MISCCLSTIYIAYIHTYYWYFLQVMTVQWWREYLTMQQQWEALHWQQPSVLWTKRVTYPSTGQEGGTMPRSEPICLNKNIQTTQQCALNGCLWLWSDLTVWLPPPRFVGMKPQVSVTWMMPCWASSGWGRNMKESFMSMLTCITEMVRVHTNNEFKCLLFT